MPASACTPALRNDAALATIAGALMRTNEAPEKTMVDCRAEIRVGGDPGVLMRRTTASTSSRRDAGSLNGPAGSMKPLPKPRLASTTAISTVRAIA